MPWGGWRSVKRGWCFVKYVKWKGFLSPLKVSENATPFSAGAAELPALPWLKVGGSASPSCTPSKAELAGDSGDGNWFQIVGINVKGNPPQLFWRLGIVPQDFQGRSKPVCRLWRALHLPSTTTAFLTLGVWPGTKSIFMDTKTPYAR